MASATRLETEICVIGGGPAGATAARRLALLGHDVCLVEREAFPRRHVGESLTPGILPLLDFLDLRSSVERAGFLRPHESMVRWDGATRRVTTRPGEPGFQVDRGRFDQLLLEAAVDAGARLLQPVSARPPERAPDGGWRVALHRQEALSAINARFLVDASGRRSVVRRGGQHDAVPTMALYAYWRGTGITDAATRVEAGADEWFWGAPLPDGTFNAAVFVDPKRYAATGRRGLSEFYRSLLADSALLRDCLGGRLASDVVACDASSRHAHRPVGEGFVKAGEASFAVDPLSSQGVQTAMASALQASTVAHTMLTRPENADVAAAFYRDRQAENVERSRTTAARFYGEKAAHCPRPFWRKRALLSSTTSPPPGSEPALLPRTGRVAWSGEVEIVRAGVIRGDVIEEARGLMHPALERPIAFLGEAPVGIIIDALDKASSTEQAGRDLARKLGEERAWRILSWLWSRRLIA